MYTAVTQNINYDYIYNYFFAPEKVKDKPYTPSNADEMKARLEAYRNKNNYNLNARPTGNPWAANVYFQEDFSKSSDGGDAADWFYNRAGSTPFSVTTPAGEKGKWLKLGYGRPIRPSLLKGPWPKDFTLEQEVRSQGRGVFETFGWNCLFFAGEWFSKAVRKMAENWMGHLHKKELAGKVFLMVLRVGLRQPFCAFRLRRKTEPHPIFLRHFSEGRRSSQHSIQEVMKER